MRFGRIIIVLSLFWPSLSAGETFLRVKSREQLHLHCAWRGMTGHVSPAERMAFCRRAARHVGAVAVSARRWNELLRGGGGVRLARLWLVVNGKTSLGWSWQEGTARAWLAGRVDACGPYRIGVRDAGLRAALRHVLRNIVKCRH